jgi:hypothetical protein
MFGLRNLEIARAVGITEDGVAALLWRAREKLRGMAVFRPDERKDCRNSGVVSNERRPRTEQGDSAREETT